MNIVWFHKHFGKLWTFFLNSWTFYGFLKFQNSQLFRTLEHFWYSRIIWKKKKEKHRSNRSKKWSTKGVSAPRRRPAQRSARSSMFRHALRQRTSYLSHSTAEWRGFTQGNPPFGPAHAGAAIGVKTPRKCVALLAMVRTRDTPW